MIIVIVKVIIIMKIIIIVIIIVIMIYNNNNIYTKISAIWFATSTSIFAVSMQGAQYDNIPLQCKFEKKIKIADSQSLPENQLKQLVLAWTMATLLIKWKEDLGSFSAASETGTSCIDIKTFELNFQLSF